MSEDFSYSEEDEKIFYESGSFVEYDDDATFDDSHDLDDYFDDDFLAKVQKYKDKQEENEYTDT